jgi:hypothetical protein
MDHLTEKNQVISIASGNEAQPTMTEDSPMHAQIISTLTLMCLFLLATPARAAQDRQDLPATMNAGSLQASLVRVLERIHSEDSRLVDIVLDASGRILRLEDSRSSLTCGELSPSAPGGMMTIQVQRFRCTMEGVSEVESSVRDGRSIQAVLFATLAQAHGDSKEGSGDDLNVRAVKHPGSKAPGFALSDGSANLACYSFGGTGTSSSMVVGPAVMTYQCLVNFQ